MDVPHDQDQDSPSALDRILISRTFHSLLVSRREDDQDYRKRRMEDEESITEDTHIADYEPAMVKNNT